MGGSNSDIPTGAQLPSSCGDAVYEEAKGQSLNELAFYVASTFCVPPNVATAICEHIFQELAQQFYEHGRCYFPNFGLAEYKDGSLSVQPSDAMLETLAKIKSALSTNKFSLAGIGIKIRGDHVQCAGIGLAAEHALQARNPDPF